MKLLAAATAVEQATHNEYGMVWLIKNKFNKF